MYDNSGETDKEVLLQSALLLSFWHSEKDSHSQPWYWSGKSTPSGDYLTRSRSILRWLRLHLFSAISLCLLFFRVSGNRY